MTELSLLNLLKSGAHFGHKTAKWHPKMQGYIYGTRAGMHILDLEKTKQALEKAGKMVSDIAAAGGTVLFVGTKKQARQAVEESAVACGMPFVTVRWLGGTFTNFRTIQKTIRRLEKMKEDQKNPDFLLKRTKKERLMLDREIQKMERLLSGISQMKKLPDAIFVASVHHDAIAVREAVKSRVKVIGVCDSNADPSGLQLMIPANDDSVMAIEFIAHYISEQIQIGKTRYAQEPQVKDGKTTPVAVDVSDTTESGKR